MTYIANTRTKLQQVKLKDLNPNEASAHVNTLFDALKNKEFQSILQQAQDYHDQKTDFYTKIMMDSKMVP